MEGFFCFPFGTTQLVYYDPKFSSGLSRRCMDMGSLSEYKNLSVAVCYSGVFSCQVAPPDNDKTQLNIPHPLTPWDLDFGEKPLSVDNAIALSALCRNVSNCCECYVASSKTKSV